MMGIEGDRPEAHGACKMHEVRILLVEGSCCGELANMLEVISTESQALAMQRITIDVSSNGEAAWDLLIANAYDIALVDLKLLGVSGLDLAWCYQQSVTECATSGASSDLQPTAMIACVAEGSPVPVFEFGVQDVLQQPFSMNNIRLILHKWLPRKACSRTTEKMMKLNSAQIYRRPSSGVFSSRVLLVENCGITNTSTARLFQELGVWIDTAIDGEEAIEMLSVDTRAYDMLILEASLPGISGYALCSWYKNRCKRMGRRPAYVVALTADPDVDTCSAFEINLCLPKPLTGNCMAALMADWLRSSSLHTSQYGTRSPLTCDLPSSIFTPPCTIIRPGNPYENKDGLFSHSQGQESRVRSCEVDYPQQQNVTA